MGFTSIVGRRIGPSRLTSASPDSRSRFLGADGPVPLRRLPVHHLPVMLPEHSH